jgi:Arc/MetJ-type ribon-helix-helix transcriptional regulator
MKKRVSATIDDKTEKILNSLIKNNKFRNKSHVIETAIELLEREENNENEK